MKQCTIVSAADRNYFWGLLLLTASVRNAGLDCPVHLLVRDLSKEQIASLKALGDVSIEEIDPANRRNPCTWKPAALQGADAEYVAWMDADCLVIGDISKLLKPANDAFQIRVRDTAENANTYSKLYAPGEAHGPVPASVQATWQQDIDEETVPRLQTAVVTNCFVLHRRHLPFIEKWNAQIEKIMPQPDAGVVNHDQPAYFMTDESVLSSLLTFGSSVPPIADFQLDKFPEKHVAHFGVKPKPWKGWAQTTWYAYDDVMATIDYALKNCPDLPELPPSLQRKNRLRSALGAKSRHFIQRTKQFVRTLKP
jgi:lipopolysaccharide biosynthesis glycosyltransferase